MEETASTARTALKYGVLTSVAIMVFTTILNISGQSQNKWLAMISYVIMIVGIVLAMKEFREINKGFMTYGEGLGLGSLVSAILGFFASMFAMVYIKFIDPTIMTQTLDKARADMEAQGLDDSQIDRFMETSEKFSSPGIMFAAGVFGYLIMGFIFSLVIAAIVRREKPVFE
ncbi:DUF4199 domain-containing protein [Dyadobacter frigoris]|uniref:DUF4199 domain-containing protein n=1 Tax=Dyadobacter frigoris TaxID=2576211 RepID=A0A4U6D9V8_9BACT|nr:DUF4199 domain-containing protein [Dyadobacter frigoris]TKT94322.1 DUF4199 domain-containing protein [Dyadobacter frigoris]GLU56658.1 hypothetical protein Dfri01_61190 [Dyadobacter frigoris]